MIFVKNVIDTKSFKERKKKKMKQNDLVKIRIYRGKGFKKGKNTIPTFYTKMNLVKKGEEEKGKQICSVTVKFTSDVDSRNITFGFLTAYVKDVGFPRVYEIKHDVPQEDGTVKDEYPTVWIRGYKSFEQVEQEIENPFITDEEDTEEHEIEE